MIEGQLPVGVRVVKRYRAAYVVVECSHDPGYRRTHGGEEGPRCRVCRADGSMTHGYAWPVKMLVVFEKPPKPKEEIVIPTRLVQESLF